MKTTLRRPVAVAMIALAGGTAHTTANAVPERPYKPGQILAKPKAGLPSHVFENLLKATRGKTIEVIGSLGVRVVSVPAQAEKAVVNALSHNPHVEFAELDQAVDFSAIPNDPQFPNAWHLPKIQAPAAWSSTVADGITIAILDTGVNGSHSDLASQMLPGWNAVDGSTTTSDIHGHGTAVAGTAAAASNNANGVAAVAWNAKIIPVRVTNQSNGFAYFSDIARGLNWAADNGADVANISFDVTTSSSVSTAAQYLRGKGGVVVVAAGNSGVDPGYSDNPNMISVSSTNSADAKSAFSNYGNYIDVGAPGEHILTTNNSGSYSNWSGTSFASPVTAGVVALIMRANPNLTPGEIETVLENSADKVAGGWHPYYGNGRVNAANAVQLAMNTRTADTTPPTATLFSPGAGSTVSGIVQVDVNANDNTAVTGVSLYANGRFIGTDATAPYQFSWDTTGTADGGMTLSAVASDAAGNDGQSAGVTVTVRNQPNAADTTPPTVSISNPVNGSTVSGTVSILVSAQDNVSVARIELYINGQLNSTVTGSSLSTRWNTRRVHRGTHTLRAVVIDSSNNSTEQSIQVRT